jgi:hypothetical protein
MSKLNDLECRIATLENWVEERRAIERAMSNPNPHTNCETCGSRENCPYRPKVYCSEYCPDSNN